MRVLLTGMTTQHVNPETHRRRVNFSGLVRDALRMGDGDDVFWEEPSVKWTDEYLSEFDAVIVGLAPISSLGANRAYGALATISKLWYSKRLHLLVDAPDLVKIESALQAADTRPVTLVKDFFAYRKEYAIVKENREVFESVHTAAAMLNNETWPSVIWPMLPWQYHSDVLKQLKNTRVQHTLGVNLDYLLFRRFPYLEAPRVKQWSYEPGSDRNWADKQNVSWNVNPLPTTFRTEINAATQRQLAMSEGTLIAPSRSGTWWSPRYAMSLVQGTPVYAGWVETSVLGRSWSWLPGTFELMDEPDRRALAIEQQTAWVRATLDHDDAMTELRGALNLDKKRAGA